MERVHKKIIPIQTATADAAYDFPLAHRVLRDMGIDFFVRPQASFDCTGVELTKASFRYDEAADVYICPQGSTLKRSTLTRTASGLSWQYLADKVDCADCPLRSKCLSEKDKRGARKIEHSYFRPERQRNMDRRQELTFREALKLRQIWCKGTFAAQKRSHNLRQLSRRGLEAAEDHCLLSATALNLKRMIKQIG